MINELKYPLDVYPFIYLSVNKVKDLNNAIAVKDCRLCVIKANKYPINISVLSITTSSIVFNVILGDIIYNITWTTLGLSSLSQYFVKANSYVLVTGALLRDTACNLKLLPLCILAIPMPVSIAMLSRLIHAKAEDKSDISFSATLSGNITLKNGYNCLLSVNNNYIDIYSNTGVGKGTAVGYKHWKLYTQYPYADKTDLQINNLLYGVTSINGLTLSLNIRASLSLYLNQNVSTYSDSCLSGDKLLIGIMLTETMQERPDDTP